ncbi:uncharacterized protein [Lepeophtheirus salmonis]|uniref:uncharacterized protein isoform X1 n=1 Tax=Lepeophtheirus salmonis TaxID=72036 RepID=UPI001AE2CC08|nr:uncharacterized protein LOC121132514 [Lepeophtheirus salmonis]
MSDSVLEHLLTIYRREFHERFSREEIDNFLTTYPSLNCTVIPFGGTEINQRSIIIFLIVLFSISSVFLVLIVIATVVGATRYKKERNNTEGECKEPPSLNSEDKKRIQDDINRIYETLNPEYIDQVTANFRAVQEEDNHDIYLTERSNYRHESLENDADILLRSIFSERRGTEDSLVSSDSNNQPRSSISNVSDTVTMETEDLYRASKHPSISEILRKKSIQDSPLMTKESLRFIHRYNKRRLGLSFQECQSRGNSPMPPRKSLPTVSFQEGKK